MSETEAGGNPQVADKEENVNATETQEKVNGAKEFNWEDAKSLYEFTVKDIDGNEVANCL